MLPLAHCTLAPTTTDESGSHVKIRSTAHIVADFPDDMVEEEDEIVQFGGRTIAEALAEILRGLGYSVSTPEHQQENGWDFDVSSEGKRVWMQVADLGGEYVLSTEFMPKISLSASKTQVYGPMLDRLNAALKCDPRFQSVKWYYRFDSPDDLGADSPLVE